jgi:hypothetical protein
MNNDLNTLMGDWRYDPNSVTARRIVGAEGRYKIQLRLDLGVLQMEVDGRQDGRHPNGFPSLADYYFDREEKQEAAGEALFELTPAEAMELQQEAAQFYYRYIANYALRDYEQVVEDTEHNLDIIDLVDRHTEDDELAWQFLQFYPYVRMMNARARGEWAGDQAAYDDAIQAVEDGLAEIREFWTAHTEEGPDKHAREIDILTELLTQLKQKRPLSQMDVLQEELQRAIASENYERAATLRDAIQKLPESKP